MSIIGEEIKSYVANQINVRQGKLSSTQIKTDEDLIYLDAKTAWVKMASGVSVTEDKLVEIGYASGSKDIKDLSGMGLAQKHVLFGGLADYVGQGKPLQTKQGIGTPFSQGTDPSSYEIDPQFGIVPRPGIKDMSIKCLNRGSLKKAKLKIRVENKYQLQILDILYLRLGYTVLLEWGNSHYYDDIGKLNKTETTLIENNFFLKLKNGNFQELLELVEAKRKKYQGNYDGFIGKVSNFDWSFNDDGSYDISLELISLGDVIESLKSNVTLDNKTNDYILNVTSGSSNITITDKSDPINSNKTLNSLFSILYLWKDQYKKPLDQFTNNTSTGYDTSKALSIDYTNDTTTTQAFIGDVPTVPSSTSLTFSKGDYELKMTVGFLNTKAATKGQYNTYTHKPKSSEWEGEKDYGWYWYNGVTGSDASTINGTTQFTLKGETQTTDKFQIIQNIINAPNTSSLGDFSVSATGLDKSKFTFKDLQFWLKYSTIDASGTPQREWADDKSLSDGSIPNAKSYYEKILNYLTIDTLTYKVASLHAPIRNKMNPFGYFFKLAYTSGTSNITHNGPSGKESITNILWRIKSTGDEKYPPGSIYGARITQASGQAGMPPDVKSALKGIVRVNASSGTGNKSFSFLKFNQFNPLFNFTEGFSHHGSNPTPFKSRYDLPYVDITLTNANVTNITVPNPLKKFKDGDVCRLYQKKQNQQTTSFSFYMRFGAVLQILKNEVISRVDVGASKNKNNPNIIIINNEPISTSSNFVSYMQNKPNLTSFDFSKCFVKSSLKFKANGSNPSYSYDIFPSPNIKPWKINNTEANSMNIYLSFKTIGEVLSSNTDKIGNVSIYNFIKELCSEINESFANVTNLEPVIDESKNVLSIIDSSKNKSSKKGIYELNPYGFNNSEGSFVRKVDLKTAITPAYATMVTVGATAGGYVKGVEATAFSNWNKGVNDRFKMRITPPTTTTSQSTPSSQIKDAILSFQKTFLTQTNSMLTPLGIPTNIENGINLSSGKWLNSVFFNDEMIETNKQIAQEYFRAYQAREKDGSSLGFIPFNVSLKMDGISGIKIYNEIILNTRFLPSNYAKNLSFIVTGVDHQLSGNDWETSLKMTLMPTPKKSYEEVDSLSFTKRNITFIQQNVVVPSPPSGPTGTLSTINNNNAMKDPNLWIYLAWNQGPGGAAQHYDIANGTRNSYSIPVQNISNNWPSGKVASNGVKKSNIASFYSTNQKALAQAFIEVWKSYYDGKVSTKVTNFQTGIGTGKTERNGIPYSEISSVFNEVAVGGITYTNMVYFAAIENNYNVDSATVTGNTTYRGMFQINKNDSNFKPILTSTSDGTGHSSGFTKYWKNGDYIRKVYPFIGQFFNSFKSNSSSWSTNNP